MESVRGSVCRSCRHRLASHPKPRTFTSSATRAVIPPESPFYVDVPASHQPFLPWRKPEKGFIPKPRELFPANRPDKGTPEYLEAASKEPNRQRGLSSSQLTTQQRYRAKMAEVRRGQFREGLTGLLQRKNTETGLKAMSSRNKQMQRAALLSQAEREDARLTNVSTPKAMQPDAQSSIEALEEQVAFAKRLHETKVANYERITAEKQAVKMDALHTLYMNARDFVTTEDQLRKLIADQFDPTPAGEAAGAVRHADFKSDTAAGISMWNMGPPDSIHQMIRTATINPGKRADSLQTISNNSTPDKAMLAREQERFKKIAEKLSGGKI